MALSSISSFTQSSFDALRHRWWGNFARPNDPTQFIAACRAEAKRLSTCNSIELTRKAKEYRSNPKANRNDEASFGLAFEAMRRVLAIELYDVQLHAGWALSQNAIVQMQTGEGKTFVSALAAIGHALAGRSVHVMTVNAYLAERDYQQMAPVYRMLGLSVGSTESRLSPIEKRKAYRSDVVYGPGYEFGFDYLRDRIAELTKVKNSPGGRMRQQFRGEQAEEAIRMQGPLQVAIVDEADSVMLDEAVTPLLISGGHRQPAANAIVYREADQAAKSLRFDHDFTIQKDRLAWTEFGASKIAQHPTCIVAGLQRSWAAYVLQAIKSHFLLQRDVHYIIADGEVQIVDQQTGRIFVERTWNDGLQQAVEAKEGLVISAENPTLASITRQRFLRLYPSLAGLTGTAEGSERELVEIYGLQVTVIPTHRPSQRIILNPHLFLDREALNQAIIEDVCRRQAIRQPVLIGTTSIRATELLSQRFSQSGIIHQSLTGRQDADEAQIIAGAGRNGTITIATNMAGRGTDIVLDTESKKAGGLHVIITELNESSRVERQLIGRAARQGDPGSSQLCISAEDPLLIRYAPDLARRIARSAQHDQPTDESCVTALRKFQKELESKRANERRQMFEYDDWLERVKREIM